MKRRFVTDEMKKEMAALAANGKSRAEIAEILDVAPSTVTKALGPVRPYKYNRMQMA